MFWSCTFVVHVCTVYVNNNYYYFHNILYLKSIFCIKFEFHRHSNTIMSTGYNNTVTITYRCRRK